MSYPDDECTAEPGEVTRDECGYLYCRNLVADYQAGLVEDMG